MPSVYFLDLGENEKKAEFEQKDLFLQHYLQSCKYCKCQNQSDKIAFELLMNFNKVFKTLKCYLQLKMSEENCTRLN